MIIGERLRELRDERGLSQGDIATRTGLMRCYISRVENGYTVPALSTIEKWARALPVPLYELFRDDANDASAAIPADPKKAAAALAQSRADARFWARFRRLLTNTGEKERQLLLAVARQM